MTRGLAAREAKTAFSLEQASPKRNMPDGASGPFDRPIQANKLAPNNLFDGHREPSNQSRHLFQMLRIMLFDGFGEPREAFVVAQGGDVVGDNAGNRAGRIGLGDWH
jgi:hypothetical protein